jgi:hypothetical protein
VVERFKRWYFPIREFERSRFYPLLGIRLFKRYLPTSGDVVSRQRGVKRIDPLRAGGRRAALEGYVEQKNNADPFNSEQKNNADPFNSL